MFELRINPDNIVDEYLTPEQRFIVSVYKSILGSEKKRDFQLKSSFTLEEIDEAIEEAMKGARDVAGVQSEVDNVSMDRIVIHGVHQFTPLILRTIEEIAKFKKVNLLINYQKQYKNIYQTWIDIYSAFDCEIIDFNGTEFCPTNSNSVSYEGNILGQNIGRLLNGRKEDISAHLPYEITEFDNMTEFASYVARKFEDAVKRDPERPMAAMKEQIYAADSSANDI